MLASPEVAARGTRFPALDPRTKIALAVLVSTVVMVPAGLRFVLPALLLGVGLALGARAWRRAAGVIAAAALAWVIGWHLPAWWANDMTAVLSAVGVYAIRFVAMAGVGLHLLATTSPTQLSVALRASRVPRAVAVTLTVMLPVFPVVAAEAAAVIDAMRLRGLAGAGGLARHPILSIERFTVSMIASSLRASEDLSASAILRGLGSTRLPTTMAPPRFGPVDLALVLGVVVLAAAAVLLPSPLG